MSFLYPEVFYMMLIPLVLLIVLVLTSKNNMERYFSKDILDKLSVGGRTLDKNTRNGMLFFTLILFIVALSRPVINQKEQDIKQKLIPIVVALDVSTSMMATDIYPNRISLAKEKLKHIISLSQNATIGVLLFAKDSFVLSPVTEDFISLNYIVKNLETNLNFPNGSNIFATLDATNYMLEDFNVKNLIILSDGGNSDDYKEEIAFAQDKNIAVYTIGVATKKGAVIPNKKDGGYLTDKDGNIVTVSLNESIKELALETNGGYVDFSLDNSDVKAILNRINTQSQKEELSTQKFKTYTELFYYPLALGLFFLLLALSSLPTKIFKQNITVLILVGLYMVPLKVDADIFDFQTIEKANQLYQDKQYSQASNEYRKLPNTPQSFFNLGDALYKEKKYQEAIEIYKKVVTEDKELERKKLHNMGNSSVKLNNLQKAKEFYEKSLKIKDDKQTQENLDIVNKELEKQKNKKQENKDNKNNKDNKDQNNKDKNQKNKKDNQEKKENQNKQNKKDKNKRENKEKQNQKSSKQEKAKNKKEDKQQQKNKKEQQKQEEKSKQNKSDKDEKGQSKQKVPQSQKGKESLKKEEISQMEEKKWMEQLEQQTTPILLRKANTRKKSKSDETKPW